MRQIALIIALAIILIIHLISWGDASQVELVCKAKAQEIAQMTYSTCVNQAKTQELNKIKSEYKDKLSQLKNYYEKRITNLSSDQNSKNTPSNKPVIKVDKQKKLNQVQQRQSGARYKNKQSSALPPKEVVTKQNSTPNEPSIISKPEDNIDYDNNGNDSDYPDSTNEENMPSLNDNFSEELRQSSEL